MSTFKVEVIRLGQIESHPNADKLGKTKVFNYPVIMQSGNFKEGDLAAYVPTDSHVPLDNPVFNFLKTKDNEGKARERIRSRKLRGILSMGILMPPPPGAAEGEDVAGHFGIIKYEAPPPISSDNILDPGFIPKYTDIESFRAYPDILQDGEEVVISEKLHGENSRYVYHEGQLWVGSHGSIKKDGENSPFWRVAKRLDFVNLLQKAPSKVFFGETFGHNKKMRYGMDGDKLDRQFRVFDVFDIILGKYLNHDDAVALANSLWLEWVPILYRGPFSKDVLVKMTEGDSTLGKNIREGVVAKPVIERFNETVGRVSIKLTSEKWELSDLDSGEH